MSALRVPAIVDAAASAAEGGLPVLRSPEFEAELSLARAWGFPLETREGRVYLSRDPDILVPVWIVDETPAVAWARLEVSGFLEIGSTSDEALARARDGAPSGSLIVAERQTSGRGRKGRPWHSPAGHGLYFTLLVAPQQTVARWPLLAHAAAVALATAIETLPELAGSRAGSAIELKWPNDVLLGGRKCAGILLETASTNARVSSAAIGVGVNVGVGAVPAPLALRATSLGDAFGVRVARRRLLVRFLREFQEVLRQFDDGAHDDILAAWKRRSTMWDGVEVEVDDGAGSRRGVTCGLTELGALCVRTEHGVETLVAGDVSVRAAHPERTGSE